MNNYFLRLVMNDNNLNPRYGYPIRNRYRQPIPPLLPHYPVNRFNYRYPNNNNVNNTNNSIFRGSFPGRFSSFPNRPERPSYNQAQLQSNFVDNSEPVLTLEPNSFSGNSLSSQTSNERLNLPLRSPGNAHPKKSKYKRAKRALKSGPDRSSSAQRLKNPVNTLHHHHVNLNTTGNVLLHYHLNETLIISDEEKASYAKRTEAVMKFNGEVFQSFCKDIDDWSRFAAPSTEHLLNTAKEALLATNKYGTASVMSMQGILFRRLQGVEGYSKGSGKEIRKERRNYIIKRMILYYLVTLIVEAEHFNSALRTGGEKAWSKMFEFLISIEDNFRNLVIEATSNQKQQLYFLRRKWNSYVSDDILKHIDRYNFWQSQEIDTEILSVPNYPNKSTDLQVNKDQIAESFIPYEILAIEGEDEEVTKVIDRILKFDWLREFPNSKRDKQRFIAKYSMENPTWWDAFHIYKERNVNFNIKKFQDELDALVTLSPLAETRNIIDLAKEMFYIQNTFGKKILSVTELLITRISQRNTGLTLRERWSTLLLILTVLSAEETVASMKGQPKEERPFCKAFSTKAFVYNFREFVGCIKCKEGKMKLCRMRCVLSSCLLEESLDEIDGNNFWAKNGIRIANSDDEDCNSDIGSDSKDGDCNSNVGSDSEEDCNFHIDDGSNTAPWYQIFQKRRQFRWERVFSSINETNFVSAKEKYDFPKDSELAKAFKAPELNIPMKKFQCTVLNIMQTMSSCNTQNLSLAAHEALFLVEKLGEDAVRHIAAFLDKGLREGFDTKPVEGRVFSRIMVFLIIHIIIAFEGVPSILACSNTKPFTSAFRKKHAVKSATNLSIAINNECMAQKMKWLILMWLPFDPANFSNSIGVVLSGKKELEALFFKDIFFYTVEKTRCANVSLATVVTESPIARKRKPEETEVYGNVKDDNKKPRAYKVVRKTPLSGISKAEETEISRNDKEDRECVTNSTAAENVGDVEDENSIRCDSKNVGDIEDVNSVKRDPENVGEKEDVNSMKRDPENVRDKEDVISMGSDPENVADEEDVNSLRRDPENIGDKEDVNSMRRDPQNFTNSSKRREINEKRKRVVENLQTLFIPDKIKKVPSTSNKRSNKSAELSTENKRKQSRTSRNATSSATDSSQLLVINGKPFPQSGSRCEKNMENIRKMLQERNEEHKKSKESEDSLPSSSTSSGVQIIENVQSQDFVDNLLMGNLDFIFTENGIQVKTIHPN